MILQRILLFVINSLTWREKEREEERREREIHDRYRQTQGCNREIERERERQTDRQTDRGLTTLPSFIYLSGTAKDPKSVTLLIKKGKICTILFWMGKKRNIPYDYI